MQEPYIWHLDVYKGRDFEERFIMENLDGTPANLSGWSVRSQCRVSPNELSELVFEFTASIVETRSTLDVLMRTEVVLSATKEQTIVPPACSAYYDVNLKNPLGKELNYVQGTVFLKGTVTENVQ